MAPPQFSLKSLIWLTLVVASFFAGKSWERRQYRQDRVRWDLNRREFGQIVVEQHETIESMTDKLRELRRDKRSAYR